MVRCIATPKMSAATSLSCSSVRDSSAFTVSAMVQLIWTGGPSLSTYGTSGKTRVAACVKGQLGQPLSDDSWPLKSIPAQLSHVIASAGSPANGVNKGGTLVGEVSLFGILNPWVFPTRS